VTDLPPKETSMVAANTIAMSFARDYMQITVILDNRDTQTDTLISVESPLGKVVILDKTIRFTDPFTPVEIPITEQTPFETGWLLMALRNFLPPPEAFPLTLTFESGKVITVAVPVLIGY
jgi:copper(I)-binding protein